MTVHDLAAESGWSASLLGYLESGERGANPRVIADVEEALGLPRGILLPEVKVFRATRVGPHVVGSAFLSGWHVEEVAA